MAKQNEGIKKKKKKTKQNAWLYSEKSIFASSKMNRISPFLDDGGVEM